MVCLSNHQFNELQSQFLAVQSHINTIQSILATVKQQSTPSFDMQRSYPSRPMTKSELAQLANVSSRTLAKWLKPFHPQLRSMGVLPTVKLLPPDAVRFICCELDIVFEEKTQKN